MPADGQRGALVQFQREGLVPHVGLSEVSVPDIELARQNLPVVSVQNRYNVTDRSWEDVLKYCESERLAFIPWFPLSRGHLDDHGPLARVAKRQHVTVAQVALAWLLGRSTAMLVIPGTSSVGHLEENVSAAGVRLTEADMNEFDCLAHPAGSAH